MNAASRRLNSPVVHVRWFIALPLLFASQCAAAACDSSSGCRETREWLQISDTAGQPQAAGATETGWRSWDAGWFATALFGPMSTDNTSDIARFDFDLDDAYLLTFELGKSVYRWRDYLSVELQTQVGRYFGRQSNMEWTAAVIGRWEKFPWDHAVDTSFAFGMGPSVASETPTLEDERRGADEGAQQVLNFVIVEFAFALPSAPEWSLATRFHHRSGVFGLFGAGEGSSAFLLGLRYRFGE